MNVKIKNAKLLIPSAETFIVEEKDFYVIDSKIKYKIDENKITIDRVLDVEGAVVMPGLVNAHHHIYSTLSKGLAVEGPLKDFNGTLEKLWWKLDRVLKKEDVISSTKITVEDCIKQGVSTVFDHHISVPFTKGSLNEMRKVFEDYGLNSVLAYEISDRNGYDVFKESLKENYDYYLKNKDNPLSKGTIGIHASFTVSDKSLQEIKNVVKDAPIHMHVAEAGSDVEDTMKMSGLSVVERLEKFNLLNDLSLIVHGNILTDKEVDILASKNLFVIHNPDSNMNNALKIRNISKTLEKGITLTIGTDGMTSNMLKSFKNAFLLNRYINQNPDTGWGEALMFLVNSYKIKKAYGFDMGLNEGDKADFIVFDYIPYTTFDNDTFLGHFLFGLTESRVRYLMKGNKFLLDDFKLTKKEDKDFYQKTLKESKELFKRFGNS